MQATVENSSVGAGKPRPLISVLIKALNEERRIGACLDSVMLAIRGLDAEVLLVDSLSNDRTVEIARRYPIRIVQFQRIEDRGCGAAVQLGFQQARGEYIYVLDADMELMPGFLALALQRLADDPGLAGVGGRLVDRCVLTEYDKRRARAALQQVADVEVLELGGGGLYRRNAVDQVGYLANRWLAAFEEADLGARLNAAGWRLLRLHAVAVTHEGHVEGNWAMLRRLWRNGRAQATGAFLRAAWGQPWWRLACRKQRHVLLVAAIWGLGGLVACILGVVGAGWMLALLALAAVPVLLLAALTLRKRSLREASWALATWHMFAAAALLGSLATPRDPCELILGRVLSGESAS
ncbi:glycosyltransferase family 2 protein [Roseateles violae]|uniref:Glycosyltransferase family A protein n=1 Tax=Roseateles violae TaxID=3058042 RepID=A0ABT8DS35_9BURK|nr:glycosyltransferase family A protein [Pelomonas sp. PFR6]MDN3920856.1 glycosyltransferase family A protein [Pelomonas sp. PFR6]